MPGAGNLLKDDWNEINTLKPARTIVALVIDGVVGMGMSRRTAT